jgi:hypothetical protein
MCGICDDVAPKCGWILANCVEDFFAGWEDRAIPCDEDWEEDSWVRELHEEAALEARQRRTDALPQAPPSKKRSRPSGRTAFCGSLPGGGVQASALSQNSPRALAGTGIEEVEPELRAESVSWFETSPSFFNDSEVLAATLLVIKSGVATDKELESWASVAITESDRVKQLGDSWVEPDKPEWQGSKTSIPYIYQPLWNALTQTQWENEDLEQIGKAMKVSSSVCV